MLCPFRCCFWPMIHVELNSLYTQKRNTKEMHCGKTWIIVYQCELYSRFLTTHINSVHWYFDKGSMHFTTCRMYTPVSPSIVFYLFCSLSVSFSATCLTDFLQIISRVYSCHPYCIVGTIFIFFLKRNLPVVTYHYFNTVIVVHTF